MVFVDKITSELTETTKIDDDGLETIIETDDAEELGDDDVSEGVTAPITDDTGTEDEATVDHTQGSDDEGNFSNNFFEKFSKKCYFFENIFFFLKLIWKLVKPNKNNKYLNRWQFQVVRKKWIVPRTMIS